MPGDDLSVLILQGLRDGLLRALSHWLFWLLILALVLSRYAPHLARRQSGGPGEMGRIDRMNGREFRAYIADLLRRLGFTVTTTSYLEDYAPGLTALRGGNRVLVHVRLTQNPVGIRAVEEAEACRIRYRCDRAVIVSNHSFTTAARVAAVQKNVELWDRERLQEQMRQGVTADGARRPLPLRKGS